MISAEAEGFVNPTEYCAQVAAVDVNGDGTVGRDEYLVVETSVDSASVNTTPIAFASSNAHLKHNSKHRLKHHLKHHHEMGSHHGLQKDLAKILAKAGVELAPSVGMPTNMDWKVCLGISRRALISFHIL